MVRKPGPRLAGKVVIVTGSGTDKKFGDLPGSGSAIARLLAQAGASVMVVDIDGEAARETCALIAAEGGSSAMQVADVSQSDTCRTVVERTKETFGSLDILVNNAAVVGGVAATDMSDADWSRIVDTNLKSAMFMSHWALKPMIDQKNGAIVNIASVGAMRCFSNPAYAAAKAGMIGLTVDLAGVYGRQGIRVNAIAPGTMNSPFARRLDDSPRARKLRSVSNPMNAEGTGWDVAWATLFLASEESRWITGTTLPVDGGLLISATLPMLPHMRDT